jgi:release factor glutamine methyltransferase
MTVANVHRQSVQQLQQLYTSTEARTLSYELLQHFARLPRVSLYAFPDTELPADVTENIRAGVAALMEHKPLQYITGETSFYGLPIEVSRAVLIPRPETEELVQWAIEEWGKEIENAKSDFAPAFIDLCTGSGCIAVALAKQLPVAVLFASDISVDALEVAQRNADRNKVDVRFFQGDLLADIPFDGKVNGIICNPPYVKRSEQAQMNANVRCYEPHIALFTDAADPLIFYRAVARFAQQYLSHDGTVFVEINEALGSETQAVFTDMGFAPVELRKDINGKERMIKAKKGRS